jgi:enterochelin esterase-like enzyme
VLAGGAAVVAVAAGGLGLVEMGALPGKAVLDRTLGACGDPASTPTATPGPMVSGSFTSAARLGLEVGWTVAYPPGVAEDARVPVCLALHGRGGDHDWPFRALHLQSFLADAVTNRGTPGFAIAAVDGGEATNWHRRASGDDPQAMLTAELIPLLAGRGLFTETFALWGWSLGGYGALLAAEALGPSRVTAVVATSPALWRRFADAGPGTFDDEADFTANDVITGRSRLDDVARRVDCGTDDPFAGQVRRLREALDPTPAGGFSSGCHDDAFWTRSAAAEIDFLGAHLA